MSRLYLHEDFAELSPHWKRYAVGTGALEPTGSTLRLVTTDASPRQYSDAQIDDYQGLSRRHFLWQPPVRLTVRARFSHPADDRSASPEPAVGSITLRGTAGFGFWNDPFMMTGARLPTLPRAIWYFYASPPSNMKLDIQTPGLGWKAATIDALRPAALALAPLAPVLVPLMNLQPFYRWLWPPVQRALNVRESVVPVDMTAWHTYIIEWRAQSAHFSVIGASANAQAQAVLDAPSPHGPLGFVMWLDNQYMVVTPWGQFRWGRLGIPGRQWLEVDRLEIAPL